jgi:TetR/AcrR family transcriptional regulator, transcriptional repressor for nem operon
MARTREFDERQALNAAMLMFWEKGYEATSILDLEQAMGIKRTSIYNAFGNKRSLFERVISCYKESVMAELFAKLDTAPDIRTGVRRLLEGALDIHFDEQYPGGCLVVLSVLESGQHDASSQDATAQMIHDLREGLSARLGRAKRRGELPPALDTGSTATAIAGMMAGMMVLGKAHFTRAALNKGVREILRLLD